MKITKITTRVVHARMRNWIFVKVETDQAGLYGWGEATLEWKTKGVVGAVEDLSVLLIGQDPRRVEHLWQVMHRQYFWRGGITNYSAMSGIDQALWDIKGKELGRPVMELLGGPVRDRLRFYDHLGGGKMEDIYGTLEPEEFGERLLASVEEGFTAVKSMPVPVSEMVESPAVLKKAARCVEEMRRVGGDGVDIMIDLHARTTPAAAIQFGRMLADYNLYWYEEPCWPESIDGLAEVARALPFPVATGERLVGRWEFRELLEKRACAVVQPDCSHCGGISEVRRIAAMAETYSMAVACHNPQGPVSTAACTHVGFATPNYLIQEVVRKDVPWRADVVMGQLPVEGGWALPPGTPGLGIDINEAEAAKHPWEPEVTMAAFRRDGSVADW
jgi:galactonate dehydratase